MSDSKIITLDKVPKPDEPKPKVPVLDLNTAQAAQLMLVRLKELQGTAVRTREIDMEQRELEHELSVFLQTHADALLATYCVLYTEYRPFLVALQPLVARIGSFRLQAQEAVEKAAKAAAETPESK